MSVFKKNEPSGTLFVAMPEDSKEQPYLYLGDLDHPLDIAKKKHVTFKVKVIKPVR